MLHAQFEGLTLLSHAAGEVTGGWAKTQLRHPLQVLAQSKQDVEVLQDTTTARLVEVQRTQASRDEAHKQTHQEQMQV